MKYNFLICSERSGSNFITSLMNGHPEISGPPPTHMFRLFGLNAKKYDPLSNDNWPEFLYDFHAARESIFSEWNTKFTLEDLKQACENTPSIAAAFDYMYLKEAVHDKAKQLFIKENHTYLIAPFILKHWPDSQFLFQVRDPRDVAASWVKTDSIAGGVEKAIDVWLRDQTATLSLLKSGQMRTNTLCIRYEDLIQQTRSTLEKICMHLNIRFSEQIFDFYKDTRTIKNASQIDAWKNINRPVQENNAGKYKQVLSPDDILYIELKCGGLMEHFNYPFENSASILNSNNRDETITELKEKLSQGRDRKFDTEAEKLRRENRQRLITRVLNRSGGANP